MYVHPERKPDKGGTILIGRHRPLSRRSWRQREAWMRQVEYAYNVLGLAVDIPETGERSDDRVAIITETDDVI